MITAPSDWQTTEETVRCTPPLGPLPRVKTAPRLGEHLSVGEAMVGHPVSVGLDVVAGAVARALRECRTAVAVVVDDADHLVGTIDRDRAECAPEGHSADELERAGPCIHESASLADAIECMVKAHARFLPVIGAERRVVGILSDVDALHGITSSRRGR